MNICVTAESAKKFRELFDSEISKIVTPDMSAEAVLQKLYATAFDALRGTLADNRLQEVIVQHMPMGVLSALTYAQDNPSVKANYKYVESMTNAEKFFLESVFGDKVPYQSVIDLIVKALNFTEIRIPDTQAVRFNSQSMVLARTSNQFSLKGPHGYYKEQQNPAKAFEYAVTTKLLEKQSSNVQFKGVLFSSIKKDPQYDINTQYKDDSIVMVPVDSTGKLLQFDQSGEIAATGKTPVFPFDQTRPDFDNFIKEGVKREMRVNQLSEQEATDKLNKQVDSFLNEVAENKARIKAGEVVLFSLDYMHSNKGFVEFNRNQPKKLTEYSNFDKSMLAIGSKNTQHYPVVKVPNSKAGNLVVLPSGLMNMSDQEIEIFHELLVNKKAKFKIEDGKVTSEDFNDETRRKLLNNFIRPGSEFLKYNNYEETITYLKTTLNENEEPTSVEVTVPMEAFTIEDLKTVLKSRDGDLIVPLELINSNTNVQVLESVDKVTELGQWYFDSKGRVREAVGPRRGFGTTTSNKEIRLDSVSRKVLRKEGDLLILDPTWYKISDHVSEYGYLTAIPTANNELSGSSPYIAFKQRIARTDVQLFFSGVKEQPFGTQVQNDSAIEWFKNSPLSEVVKLMYSKEDYYFGSDKGPQAFAQFLKDTITLFNKGEGVLIYHEAFHAYFNGILSKEERSEIFDTLRKKPGKFSVWVNGSKSTVSYSEATDLQLEEYLAEEFRAYATDGGKTKQPSKIAAFFKKLLDALKSIFGKMSYAEMRALGKAEEMTGKVFADLYSGNFTTGRFNSAAVSEAKFASMSLSNLPQKFTRQEAATIETSMSSVFSLVSGSIINNQMSTADRNTALSMLLEMSTLDQNSPEYAKVNDEFNEFSRTSIPRGTAIAEFINEANLKNALSAMKMILEARQEVARKDLQLDPNNKHKQNVLNWFTKMLDPKNFGSIEEVADYLKEEEPTTIISDFLKSNPLFTRLKNTFVAEIKQEAKQTDLEREIENSLVDDTQAEVSVWGADMYNNTIPESVINEQVKALLETTPSYTKQGKGVIKLNSNGFPQLATVSYMKGKLLRLLNGSVDALEMNSRLREAAKNDNEFRHIYNMIGDLEYNEDSFSKFEHAQWNAFYHEFDKTFTPMVAVIANKKNYYKEVVKEDQYDDENEPITKLVLDSSELTLNSGKIDVETTQMSKIWESEFLNILETDPDYVMTDESGRPYLDLALLLNDYTLASEKGYKKIEAVDGPDFVTSLVGLNPRHYSPLMTKAEYDPVEFLSKLGIVISDDVQFLKGLINGDESLNVPSGIMTYFLWHLQNSLTKQVKIATNEDFDWKLDKNAGRIYSFRDLFKEFMYRTGSGAVEKATNHTNILNHLIKLQNTYSNDNISFMSFTAEGTKANQMSYKSSLYDMIRVFNSVKSYDELIATPGMEYFDPEYNPAIASHPWLATLFDSNGKRNTRIKLTPELISGSKVVEIDVDPRGREASSDKGVSSLGSDETTKFISDIVLTRDGRKETLRAEAKNTSVALIGYVKKPSDGTLRGSYNLVFNDREVNRIFKEDYSGTLLSEMFVPFIEMELIRLTKVKKILEENKGKSFIGDPKILNRAKSWQQFEDILSEKVKKDLELFKLEDPNFLMDILKEEYPELLERIENDLKKYAEKKSNGLYTRKMSMNIPESLVNKAKITKDEGYDDARKRLIQTHWLNDFYQNLAYSTFFLGDLSNYNVQGEDFHKRLAGLISTGKGFRNDSAWLKFLNSEQAYPFAYSKGYKPRQYDGYLNTGVIEDKNTVSDYLEYYRDVVGVEETKAYEGMDEADGQGFISFDAYRLLNQSSDEWSDQQETLYQKMISGESVTMEEAYATFPVRKFQYYGHVTAENSVMPVAPIAFHKYSLVPLIPNMIKGGSKIEKLHEKMMEQGLDYVTMGTGSKLATMQTVTIEGEEFVGNRDMFYDNNRQINEDPNFKFTVNRIHTRFLKNQLFLAEGYKGKVSLPTQLRKIILLLSENSDAQWRTDYNSALYDFREYYFDELREDLGLSIDPNTNFYRGSSAKIKDFLKKALEEKELLAEEIEAIIDPQTNELISDLSLSLHSAAIEKALITMVDKKLRRLKVKGEALVQVSGAMFELLNANGFDLTEVRDQENKLRFGSNNLRFFHGVDANGKPVTNKDEVAVKTQLMEVMISLQGDFEQLLLLKHTDGKKIRVFTEDGKVDHDKSLDRLNEMMEDENFRKENESVLSVAGVRIPTQGPNALMGATIKKFLPKYAGPVVILPAEIVAQAGSDYDIDKIYTMFKSMAYINGKVHEVSKSDSKKSKDELKKEVDTLWDEIKQSQKDLDKLYDDRSKYYSLQKEIRDMLVAFHSSKNGIIEPLTEYRKQLYTLLNQAHKKEGLFASYSYKERTGFITQYMNKLNEVNEKIEEQNADIEMNIRKNFPEGSVEEYFTKSNAERDRLQKKLKDANEKYMHAKIDYLGKTVSGIENRFVNLILDRIQDPKNLKMLVTPNTVTDAQGMAEEISQRPINTDIQYDKRQRLNSTIRKGVSPSEVLGYEYNLFKHQENSVGKDSLGIAAISATFHALFTTVDGTVSRIGKDEAAEIKSAINIVKGYLENPGGIPYSNGDKKGVKAWDMQKVDDAFSTLETYAKKTSNLPTNTNKGLIKFGEKYNQEDKEISDLISQLINGYVDVAKDAWIFLIEGNKENTPVLLAMVMAGIPLKTAVHLSTHPLVRQYTRSKQAYNGAYSNLEMDRTIYTPAIARRMALSDLSVDYGEIWYAENGYKEGHDITLIHKISDRSFSAEEIQTLSEKSIDDMTADDVALFSEYLHFENIANEITSLTNLLKFDTKKISTMNDASERLDARDKYLRLTPMISYFGADAYYQMIDDTHLGAFNNDETIAHLFDSQFEIRNNTSLTRRAMTLPKLKGVMMEVLRSNYKNDFVWFIYQNAVYSGNTKTIIDKDGKPVSFNLVPTQEFNGIEISYENDVVQNSVNLSIDTSREWKGDLKTRPVYTKEGVNTMRTTDAKLNEHFGNPFSEAGYGDTVKVRDIPTAVKAYKEWLLTGYAQWLNSEGEVEEFAGKQEQREWILNQINQGKLDNATLLYAGKSAARGQGMHPTALVEVVKELRGNLVQNDNAVDQAVLDLFKLNPELSSVGTPEQYSKYLDTIFPESKVKDIVYHGTNRPLEQFNKVDVYEEYGSGAIFFANLEYAESFATINDKGEKTVIPTLINIKNPLVVSRVKFMRRRLKPGWDSPSGTRDARDILAQNQDNDGLIGVDYSNMENTTHVVRDSDQTHVLGTKQDIEGFKNFVSTQTQAPTVYYNPVMGVATEIGYSPEHAAVSRFFSPTHDQAKNFIAYLLEYNNLVDEYSNKPYDQVIEELYMFDKANDSNALAGEESHRMALYRKAALFRSRNPEAMFDKEFGLVPIFLQLKSKYPELGDYDLVNDLRWDNNGRKSNIFFPSLNNNPELLSRYKENLEELANHPSKDVASFFNVDTFTHFALMQTGLNRGVKYDFARIGNPMFLRDIILNSEASEKLFASLKQADILTAAIKRNKSISQNSQLLEQYHAAFTRVIDNKMYGSRSRGINYTTTELATAKVVEQVDDAFTKKVKFVNPEEALYTSKVFNENADKLEEFIQLLSEMPYDKVLLPNTKIEMSNPSDQVLLDELLNKYLNVDNTGSVPKELARTLGESIGDSLNITALVGTELSKRNRLMYDNMAKKSNKAVIVSADPLNKGYVSNVQKIKKFLKNSEMYSDKLNNTSFTKNDTVFVAGSSVSQNAYSGFRKEEYEQKVIETFEKEMIPLLQQIMAGGATVRLSASTGMDEMAKSYLENYNYVFEPVFESGMKHYVGVPFERSPRFVVESPITGNNTFNEIYSNIGEDVRNQISALPDSEIQTKGVELMEKAFTEYLKNNNRRIGQNYYFRDQVINALVSLGREQSLIAVGNNAVAYTFELVVKNYRDVFFKHYLKNTNQRESQNMKENLLFIENYSVENWLPPHQLNKFVDTFMKRYPSKYQTKSELINAINRSLEEHKVGTLNLLKNCL